SKGCQNNKIINCKIYDLGGGGIKIGERIIREEEKLQTYGNEIKGCVIKDGGKIFHSAVGIWIGQSYKNLIENNQIYNFYYTGISIGWTWGYGKSLAGQNIVKFNKVHHIGKKKDGDGPILSDMGGIYTLGIQDGTLISNNIFYDIYGYKYGGWGIYFDEGSTHIIAEKNLVYNTTHGGFHQHYGKENIVRNNIFAFGKEQQIQISRPENHRRFTFERNIVVGNTERWIYGAIDFNFVFNNNLYFRINGKDIKIVEREGKYGEGKVYNLKEWKEKGMDTDSIIKDPLFYDMKNFDFRLKDNSPAFKIGFNKFKLPR
ncbi:MAG: right-handed parallel beta-helix repeat-containing protein, partial [Candidatus Ratteibacteria bacterium]